MILNEMFKKVSLLAFTPAFLQGKWQEQQS